MKIASVTLFCNEGFRLNPWVRYFSEYKDDIYLQIIVNNGNPEDTILLKSAFPDAVVLFSKTPNMIASYNLAIKYILEKTDADSILQITNDLRIEKGGLAQIHEILFREQQYGMISPILLKKDSEIVENYGAEIDFSNITKISGMNGAGKSSIATAYTWVLFDCDYNLKSSPAVRREVDGEPVMDSDVEVTLVFNMDGKEISMRKIQHRTISKDGASYKDDNKYFIICSLTRQCFNGRKTVK